MTTQRVDKALLGGAAVFVSLKDAGVAAGKTVAIRIPGQLIIRHSTAAPRI